MQYEDIKKVIDSAKESDVLEFTIHNNTFAFTKNKCDFEVGSIQTIIYVNDVKSRLIIDNLRINKINIIRR